MIDLKRVSVLRSLSQHGTVAATAAALHLTPSAVSQSLAALHRETGVSLLDPDGRRVRLTGAAWLLLEHAEGIFVALERAEADLASYAEGTVASLTLAAFPTAMSTLAVPAVTALALSHPRVGVSVLDRQAPHCWDDLVRGTVDVVVSVQHATAPTHEDPRFTATPLVADILDAVLPVDHRLAGKPDLTLTDLADEPWIGGLDGTTCQDVVMGACAMAGFTPRLQHRTDDYTAVGGLVAGRLGVALVPRLARLEASPARTVIPLTGVVPMRHVFLGVRRGSETAPAVHALVEALVTAAADLHVAVPAREPASV